MSTRLKESNTYVALLRGINVGGKNMLPMADLAKMFVAEGCEDVRTFIQSGNVVFNAAPELAEGLPKKISARILKKFRFAVPVVLRTADQLAQVTTSNPFLKAGAPEDVLHVMFLAHEPTPERVALLDPKRSPPDEFIVRGQEVFLKLPKGVAPTKLTNAYFDSKLEAVSTSRNWRTVLKLLEMMKE